MHTQLGRLKGYIRKITAHSEHVSLQPDPGLTQNIPIYRRNLINASGQLHARSFSHLHHSFIFVGISACKHASRLNGNRNSGPPCRGISLGSHSNRRGSRAPKWRSVWSGHSTVSAPVCQRLGRIIEIVLNKLLVK